ncbi:MAG: AAA domain-containing protein [Syntrophomonadaceae bacterium]|nr:AAA domain-containing protein [Syntrophomonadaceae bacterium]
MAEKKYKLLNTLNANPETNSYVLHYLDKQDNKEFVIKRIEGLDNPLLAAIFDKEIQALKQLRQSENIVKLLDYQKGKNKKGIYEGRIFIEYIDGKTLDKCCTEIISFTDIFNTIKQLISAIEFAHEKGIIHRDINPKNIMLTFDLFVKVIDFGICKIKGMISKGTTFQFATNKYAAPEVRYHSENATEQSDIYSLGAVFFYLFTKKEPPAPADFKDTIQTTSGIDPKMKEILLRMTCINPEERYENLIDLESALAPLYQKYLKNDEKYHVSVPISKFDYLKRNNLVSKTKNLNEIMQVDLITNFSDAYMNKETEANDTIYLFDGLYYSMKCIYNPDTSIFQVIEFRRLPLNVREKNKKTFMYVSGHFNFISASIRTASENNCHQLINRFNDHFDAIRSKKNVQTEFLHHYGFWYEFLKIMEDHARDSAPRFQYHKYTIDDGLYHFHLKNVAYLCDDDLTENIELAYEQSKPNDSEEKDLKIVGKFLHYAEDGKVIVVKPSIKINKPPKYGILCVNYKREIAQYQRQKRALDDFVREEYSSTGNLKSIFVGIDKPNIFRRPGTIRFCNSNLDHTQQMAVQRIIEARDIALIQGPPGTGKTNVIVEVIRQVIRSNNTNPQMPEKILLVSQSHAAVDKILEDLDPFLANVNTVRIGSNDDLSDLVKAKYGIENKKIEWLQEVLYKSKDNLKKSIKKLHIEYEDFVKYANAMENLDVEGTSDEESNQYSIIIKVFNDKYEAIADSNSIKRLLAQNCWIKQLAETGNLEEYFIKSANIVAGTCSGFSSNPYINGTVFDYVIVDEAAKATLPEILIPLVRATKVVLVGDHKQLPPVFDEDIIRNSPKEINKASLTKGGFEKIFNMLPDESKLTLSTQYRMHPIIGDMISSVFYPENDIQNGVSFEERENSLPSYYNTAMLWISTSGQPFEKRKERKDRNEKGKDTYNNHLEAKLVAKEIAKLNGEIGNKDYTVAVITPYQAQVKLIKRELQKFEINNISVDVNTVDAFQGSQKDIILYSTVRSNEKPKIGFLREQERVNVSFSRSSRLLIIIGDSVFLNNKRIQRNKFPEIINYMKSHPDYCRFC